MNRYLGARLLKIDEERQNLEKKKKQILLKEKLIREKENRLRLKRCTEVGKIAAKAKIQDLDNDLLLGAFLEISKNANREEAQNRWLENAIEHDDIKKKSLDTPLSVSFSSAPSHDAKTMLKEMGFRWNSFRKEFCGYGSKETLANVLQKEKPVIEILN